jgi:hypothetical protein
MTEYHSYNPHVSLAMFLYRRKPRSRRLIVRHDNSSAHRSKPSHLFFAESHIAEGSALIELGMRLDLESSECTASPLSRFG